MIPRLEPLDVQLGRDNSASEAKPGNLNTKLSGSVKSAARWISAADVQETVARISHFRAIFPEDMSGPPVAYVYGAKEALLVAAAPELLAALTAMEAEKADYMRINHLGDPAQQHTNRQARAAIAKATGQEAAAERDRLADEGQASGMNPKGGPA